VEFEIIEINSGCLLYIHNDEKLTGPHVGCGLWRDHRLEFPGLSHFAVTTVFEMATSTANKGVFIIDDHVNSRRGNLKEHLSEQQTLFQQCSEKEALKFD